MKKKIYHTVTTVPKSNEKNCRIKSNLIPITLLHLTNIPQISLECIIIKILTICQRITRLRIIILNLLNVVVGFLICMGIFESDK